MLLGVVNYVEWVESALKSLEIDGKYWIMLKIDEKTVTKSQIVTDNNRNQMFGKA